MTTTEREKKIHLTVEATEKEKKKHTEKNVFELKVAKNWMHKH